MYKMSVPRVASLEQILGSPERHTEMCSEKGMNHIPRTAHARPS